MAREEEGVHGEENKQSTKFRTRRYVKARSSKKVGTAGTKNEFALGAEPQDDNDFSAKPKIPYWC